MVSMDIDVSHYISLDSSNTVTVHPSNGRSAYTLNDCPGAENLKFKSVHAGEDFSILVDEANLIWAVAHSSRPKLNAVMGFHAADEFRVNHLYEIEYLNYKIRRGGYEVRIWGLWI